MMSHCETTAEFNNAAYTGAMKVVQAMQCHPASYDPLLSSVKSTVMSLSCKHA